MYDTTIYLEHFESEEKIVFDELRDSYDWNDMSYDGNYREVINKTNKYLNDFWESPSKDVEVPPKSYRSDLGSKSHYKDEYQSSTKVKSRNRDLSQELKERYNNTCQICNTKVEMDVGIYKCETHHIHPRGKGGPDSHNNMICVCFNCHEQFDLGAITVDLVTKRVYHKNDQNPLNGLRITLNHSINQTYIDFHNKTFGFRF